MKKETFEQITDYLTKIIKGSEFYGYVFAVGGCCRDYLAGRDIKDIDLVVALPDGGIKFAQWLESNGYTKGSVVTYRKKPQSAEKKVVIIMEKMPISR